MTAEESEMGGSKSPYPACNGLLMVEASQYKKNEAYWKQRVSTCDSKVANCALTVQLIPDTGVFASMNVVPGQNVASTSTVAAFLETVRVRASEDLGKGIQKLKTLKSSCLEGSKTLPTCDGSIEDIRKRVAKELPGFRSAVALMAVPSDKEIQKAIIGKDVSALINDTLSADRTFSLVPKMEKLTPTEFATAKKYFENLIARARTEFAEDNEKLLAPLKVKGRETDLVAQRKRLERPENFTFKVKELLNKARGEAALNYAAAITRVPEIAYVGDGKAADAVIGAGLATMIKDSQESLARIKKSPTSAKDLAATKTGDSLLQYVAYSRLIDTMLTEEATKGGKSSCALATAAFNQLKTAEGRNAGYATAGLVGATVAFAFAPGVSSLAARFAPGVFGAGMSAGAAAVSANLAVASGLIGGFAMTAADTYHAANVVQDARSGLVTAKDAQEAKGSAAIGLIASPLNFLGSGALVGGAVSLGAKTVLSRFGANAIAKGAVKAAGTSAEEVAKLATTAAAVKAGETVAEGAKNSIAKQAIAASEKLDKTGSEGATALLNRKPTTSDENAFKSMADAGYLGTEKAPNFEVAKAYASVTQKIPEAERAKFASDLEKVIRVAKQGAAAGKSDAVRDTEVALTALEIVKGAPDKEAAAVLLQTYDATALRGVREVWKSAAALANGVKETVANKAAATAKRVKTVLARFTGKDAESAEVKQLCICMAACPLKVAKSDPFEIKTLAAPTYMACSQ